jgi:pyruvate dehydrogenase E2 component (dihydrolipoamide acetyltransferase)
MTNKDYQVVMPKLGLTMTEAKIIQWHKADGQPVEKGEVLFSIETEKVTLEIEAPASGTLQVLVPAGQTVPVHTPVAKLLGVSQASLDVEAETLEVAAPSAPQGDRVPPRSVPPGIEGRPYSRSFSGERLPASPKARHLARRLNIPLNGVQGSGPRGMIVTADVKRAAASQPKTSPVARKLATEAGVDFASLAGSGPSGRIMRQDVELVLATHKLEEQPIPLSGLRAIIAERMSVSWRERPHVTLTTEADATNLVAARQQAGVELGHKIAYDALLVALVARALGEHPHVNVRLGDGGIEQLSQINVGVAVDTERGLLVPVVPDAGAKNLLDIHQALAERVERALAGHSLPDDLSGGTFTLTNLGMFEIDTFTPIINPPESAILGVGRIVAKPVVVDGQIVARQMMALSLSFDHRLIDGAPAARFLQRVKQLVERPFILALPPSEG